MTIWRAKMNLKRCLHKLDEELNIYEEEDVEDIEVENPGLLEVPEGKEVNDLPISHFKNLVGKKGYEEIIRGLQNLRRWNKNKNPELSNWADDMMDKLKKWVDKKRKDDPEFAM